MYWQNYPLKKLHIELSSLCNATCPLCPRHISTSPNTRLDLVQQQISTQQFKNYFDKKIIQGLDKVLYCGTMGDPVTNKDLIDIVTHVTEINPNCEQVINTNGGLRSEKFWKQLAEIFNNDARKVTFSIDGLEDTNHLYRRNVQWEKVIHNVKTFINHGGHARWEFLVFKHNQHQIDQARALSQTLGFKLFLGKKPFGLVDYSSNTEIARTVFDKDYNAVYQLEQSTLDTHKSNLPKTDHIEKYSTQNQFKNTQIESMKSYVLQLDTKNINCASLENGVSEVYVNSQGIVFPCCFVGTSYDDRIDNFLEHQIKHQINSNKHLLDLNKQKLSDIIQSGIIDQIFSNQWNRKICDGKIGFCSQTCGNSTPVDRIYAV